MPDRRLTLDDLPMFATDKEIAVAIVGKDRAGEWLAHALPALEARGFPPFDRLHQGRPVPSIREYYLQYLGLHKSVGIPRPDGEDRVGQWHNRPKRFSAEAKAEKTVAAPISPEELEEANRRREKRLGQAAARQARLAAMKSGEEPSN